MNENQIMPEEGVFNFEDLINQENINLEETDEEKKALEEELAEKERIAEEERIASESQLTDEEKQALEDQKTEAERLAEEERIALEAKKTNTVSPFKDRVTSYLDSGRWQDAYIEIDGKDVALSTLEEIDEELFFQLDEEQERLRTEDLKEKYINLDDLDETTQKLNKIALAGGDITELIKAYDQYVHPLEGLDLESEKVQEALVRDNLTRLGLETGVVDLTIDKYKKDLTLDDKANKIVDNINTAFNRVLEEKQKEADLTQKQQKEDKKIFKDNLTSSYKEDKINDKEIKKLIAFGTASSRGESEVQKEFNKIMADPKKAADLIFFLHNTEAFLKFKGAATVRDTQVTTLKKLSLIPTKDKSGKGSRNRKVEETSDFNFVDQTK